MRMVNLAVAFLLELCMLAAFAYWGFQTGSSTVMQVLLGIGVPVVVVIVWGMLLAPNSARRLKGAAYLGLKSLLFGLAVLALAAAGQTTLALVFAAVAVVNQVLLTAWHDE